ncbi:MAG: DNRLRE domain-containing protein [Verrucomicrobiota bacterium]
MEQIEEVFELCEQVLEGTLTPEGKERLEQLVRDNADARRAYVQYLQVHAGLHWSVGAQAEFSVAELEKMAGNNVVPLPTTATRERNSGIGWRIAALAASLVLTIGLIWLTQRGATPGASAAAEFARLAETKNCQWGPSGLPTEEGSRLGAGRLRLAEGLAVIVFDSGARVTLEAPAELELVSMQRCVLHQGMLVAKVPPAAIGFTVETATARLIDYGTEFGVSAGPAGETQVQVIEGIVDVQHIKSGAKERLTAGKNSRVSATLFAVSEPPAFEPQRANLRRPAEIAPGTVTITTASGRGKDAYVQTEPSDMHGSDVLLLVKNAKSDSYRRKAYLGFDLASLDTRRLREASLVLRMEPSGYGYASLTPVSTFTVYGLTDQSLDNWPEAGITWDNAPANLPGGAEVDLTKAVPVGSFEVPEGLSSGEFTVSGPALADFLRQDVNGLATFILVRETRETRPYSLVHGFISKRHPSGTPPTLRLVMER